MGARENPVQHACGQLLTMLGIFHWRNNSRVIDLPGVGGKSRPVQMGVKGGPDWLGVLPGGRALGVECKAPACVYTGKRAGTLSPSQREFRERFEAPGGLYVVAHSVGDLEDGLKKAGYL